MAQKSLAAQPRHRMDAASGIRAVPAFAPLSESAMRERVARYNSPLERKKRLLLYLKPEAGPWRAEFTRSLCGSAVEAERLWQDTRRPVVGKEGIPSGLLERIESAAAALGFGLRGIYHMGLHEVPHSCMLPCPVSEGLAIADGELLSPMIVSPEHMLLQCGELPFILPYGSATDLRPIFANTLLPESFF